MEKTKQKKEARELIAAGGCYAIQLWSRTDADRLCPKKHNHFDIITSAADNSEWVESGKKAIELIQKGINLLNPEINPIDEQLIELGYNPENLESRGLALIRILKENVELKKQLTTHQFTSEDTGESIREVASKAKDMATKFMTWFTSIESSDAMEKILNDYSPTENGDVSEYLYDVWVERYFTPDTIPTPSPTVKEANVLEPVFRFPSQDEINEAQDKYGFRVPYDGTNNFYDKDAIKHFAAGVDWAKKWLEQIK
ncbi:MAG: hypothetical protein V4547_17215 [Bacteroidota bacterium]